MMPDALQQFSIAVERFQTILILWTALWLLLVPAFTGAALYLTFGRVLIPLTRSLCNFLDAHAWHVDHQYRTRPGHGEQDPDSRYMPK
jgi:hypothetical protein